MKKVISFVFNNFKNDSRVLKECTTLVENGYDVTVYALYEEGLKESETISNIKVRRIRLATKELSKSLFMQIFKYLELAFKIVKMSRNKVDIIHCNDIMPLPIAVLIKKLSGGRVKIIYDAHEFQTETQKLVGKKLRKNLTEWTEKFFIRHVDKTLTVSDGIAEEYQKRYNISKPKLVLNCPSYKQIPKENKFRELYRIDSDQVIFLYQGALTPGRGIEKLISAFEERKDKAAVLIFMGYGQLAEKVKAAAEENENIFYKEAVAPNEVLSYTASADIGISLIENSCLNYYYCLPNKLFEYSMVGLPVVVSNLPEMKEIVLKNQNGIVVKENTVTAFKAGIDEILEKNLQEMANRSLELAKTYNWQNQEQTLLQAYGEL
ncbi:glycosyltransferase family 4 protein [Metabacillus halosaccharovorans]|uniref:Glycosyltransferase family 4 protein n=1 Tax=Metabacillus halosaccharovorans TaxID=930124 RepID=A0ABT3DD47_9BACI|nr:glycosyltransferase family 4 protein [Metabacillus halosaccharovorans]MCV9884753.1 glycosyltransferase family 4 protein [Metabacillus halosaccharovorans]